MWRSRGITRHSARQMIPPRGAPKSSGWHSTMRHTTPPARVPPITRPFPLHSTFSASSHSSSDFDMAFVPPFPPHPPEAPGPLKMLKMARRNLLEIWPEATFHQTHFEHALFRRRIFVCNSPETVRQVFVEDAANV